MNKTEQPGIRIAQIILERAEFSHREDFLSYPKDTKIELQLQYAFRSGVTPEQAHGIARIDVRTVDASQLYSLAFTIAGLIEAEAHPSNFPLKDYVGLNAWVTLFPFLREAVANVTGRGRFGPILLNPVNIQALVKEQARGRADSRNTAVQGRSPAAEAIDAME